MTEAQDQTESRRGRVREALVTGLGFKFPRGTSDEEARKRIDGICDALVRLTDENLRRVIATMKTKGEGSSRCFWPPRASFLAYAEIAQPEPLENIPELASWFASRAGQEALADGRLVAELLFWDKHKRPPVFEGDPRRVRDRADELETRRKRAVFNRDAGRAPVADDLEFLAWYEALEARAMALVEAGNKGQAA